jgi:hypothetical protein
MSAFSYEVAAAPPREESQAFSLDSSQQQKQQPGQSSESTQPAAAPSSTTQSTLSPSAISPNQLAQLFANTLPAAPLDTSSQFSTQEEQLRSNILQQSLAPHLHNDAADLRLPGTPDIHAIDPLFLEIWKFYSKTKSQLPCADRLENLSWRIMSMNLDKLKQQNQRCVSPGALSWHIISHTPNPYCTFSPSLHSLDILS